MSRFLQAAALAAFTAILTPAQADSIAAAITPPLPRAELPTPNMPDGAVTFAALPLPTARPTATPHVDLPDIVARQANISNFGTACGPSLTLRPTEGAMLALSLRVPCQPSSMVTITHSGLSFTAPVSMTGALDLRLPAMESAANVTATLADATTLDAATYVPQFDAYARVALQWDGPDPGALIAAAPAVLQGDLFTLGKVSGSDSKTLHIFSRRVDDVASDGVVRLSLRADITDANCADPHQARVRRVLPGEPVVAYDMRLAAPGCDAVGQSLELKNVVQDLKLAAQ